MKEARTKPSTKSKKRELLSRDAVVSDWTMDIYVRVEGGKLSRSRDSSQYLLLDGDLTEPLNGSGKFLLQVQVAADPGLGARDTPSIGSVIQIKPNIQAVVTLTPEEFQSVSVLAASGKLRSVIMVFHEPRYGRAPISAMSFTSRLRETE